MRKNLQIKVITFSGSGAIQEITGVGFRPQFVLIKGGANIACFRTRQMKGDKTAYAAGNTAHFAGGILGFTNDGFIVGTDAKANAAATTYYALCIRGSDAQDYFRVFTYLGNASNGRQLTASDLKFQPDIAYVKGDTAQNGSIRTAEVSGDNSWHLSGSADAADEIEAFLTNGLQLGTSARVNGSGIEYVGWAMKKLSGVIACGTYTGNGVDNREISGLGFPPDFVIVKNAVTTNASVLRTSDFVGDSSTSLGAAGPTTNQIQSFTADGFVLGTSAVVNTDGEVYWWYALKAGDVQAPLSRVSV